MGGCVELLLQELLKLGFACASLFFASVLEVFWALGLKLADAYFFHAWVVTVSWGFDSQQSPYAQIIVPIEASVNSKRISLLDRCNCELQCGCGGAVSSLVLLYSSK